MPEPRPYYPYTPHIATGNMQQCNSIYHLSCYFCSVDSGKDHDALEMVRTQPCRVQVQIQWGLMAGLEVCLI
jgi:hypothetical protein